MKIIKAGDRCRRYGTPVIWKHSSPKSKVYNWFLFCPSCHTIYYVNDLDFKKSDYRYGGYVVEKKEEASDSDAPIFDLKGERGLAMVFTDGATVGHNGKLGTVNEVGLGVLIYFSKKNTKSEFESSIKYFEKTTGLSNNEAEFKALIKAMQICIEQGVLNAYFYLDSKIVVNRANNKISGGNERMAEFQKKVIILTKKFGIYGFKWIPREKNTIADELSKKACLL